MAKGDYLCCMVCKGKIVYAPDSYDGDAVCAGCYQRDATATVWRAAAAANGADAEELSRRVRRAEEDVAHWFKKLGETSEDADRFLRRAETAEALAADMLEYIEAEGVSAGNGHLVARARAVLAPMSGANVVEQAAQPGPAAK